ncbi:MAG TPA: hypothetical protein VFV50_19510, partial [Bdellovibrionales bacterium]|nr:hypothetical protein [Bdellovibrionales bacterium]
PTLGGTAIPAKYYHVMGGAYMACRLRQRGGNPLVIKQIEGAAAYGYRSHRIGETKEGELKLRASKLAGFEEYNRQRPPNQRLTEEQYLMQALVNGLVDFDKPEAFAVARLASSDAYYLMDRFFVGVGTANTGFQTDFSKPLSMLLAENAYDRVKGRDRSFEPWSRARFTAAVKKLSSIMVDWKWTVEQHKVGAEFGASKCYKIANDQELEQKACAAKGAAGVQPVSGSM